MFFLAFLNSEIHPQNQIKIQKVSSSLAYPVIIGLGICLIVLILKTNVNVANANMLLLKAIGHIHLRTPDQAWLAYKKAEETSSIHIDHARSVLASALMEQLPLYVKEGKNDEVLSFLVKMFEELEKNKTTVSA